MVGTPSALSSETVRSPFRCERSVESARSSRTVDSLACKLTGTGVPRYLSSEDMNGGGFRHDFRHQEQVPLA